MLGGARVQQRQLNSGIIQFRVEHARVAIVLHSPKKDDFNAWIVGTGIKLPIYIQV